MTAHHACSNAIKALYSSPGELRNIAAGVSVRVFYYLCKTGRIKGTGKGMYYVRVSYSFRAVD